MSHDPDSERVSFNSLSTGKNTMSLGSPGWMAPETFHCEHYDEKVDVYSYGVLLWEILEKKVPYEDEDYPPYAIVYKVRERQLSARVSL